MLRFISASQLMIHKIVKKLMFDDSFEITLKKLLNFSLKISPPGITLVFGIRHRTGQFFKSFFGFPDRTVKRKIQKQIFQR